MQTTTFEWPNTAAMLHDLDGVKLGLRAKAMEARHGQDSEWSGAKSWTEATERARHGINRNLADFAQEDARLGRGLAPRRVHDVMGLAADVGRIAVGAPDSMIARTRRENPLFVRALIHIGANCNVSKRTLEKRGMNVLRVVRALEETGNRVSIVVCDYSRPHGPGNALMVSVNLKTFGAFVDAQEIAFYVSDVAAFRWLMFRAVMVHAKEVGLGGQWSCLGTTENVPQADRADADLYVPIPVRDGEEMEPSLMVQQALDSARKRSNLNPNTED